MRTFSFVPLLVLGHASLVFGHYHLPSTGPWLLFPSVRTTHAVLASLAWGVFFPLGAILIRTVPSQRNVRYHYLIQIFAFLIFTVGAGTGIWLALLTSKLNAAHSIIGLTVFATACLQAAGGTLQHYLFRQKRNVAILGAIHVWLGRCLITLGMVNAELGLLISRHTTRTQYIAYGVVAALIWGVYVAVVVIQGMRKKM